MKSNLVYLIPDNVGKTFHLVERNRLYHKNSECFSQEAAFSRADIKWITNKYFGNRKNLKRYLKSIQIDLDSILLLLQTPSPKDVIADVPWKDMWSVQRPATLEEVEKEHSLQDQSSVDLLCGQILSFACGKMVETLNDKLAHGHKIDQDNVLQDFVSHLYQKLSVLLTPSIIVETNLARLKFAAQATQDGRKYSYTESLYDTGNQRKFWNKYPVLWRLASAVVQNTTNSCIETIDRIADNRVKISATFGIEENIVLSSIKWGSGDVHREGRVVAILDFGTSKLVYKPRPLAIDKAYNQFIEWYASIDRKYAPKSYLVLDCETHGYVEYIQASACTTKAQIKTFYKKIGSLIAVSWLLGITDLHLENVLASEQNPYLVDVEAMFDRPVKQLKEKKTFTELYSQASHDLLFRTGLLPARMKGKNGVYDISAIGAGSDQNAPLEFLTVENFGSDEIRLVAQPGRIFKSHNSPSPDDPTHQPHHYTNEIVDGFERTMSVFRSQKDFLASSKSVLRLFDTVEVRWVARATMDYGKFMEKMLHPSVVGDALQCDLLIGGDLSSTTDIAPHMTPIIPSEVADLWNYDVPYFSTFADSTDLYDSKGKVFKNFFEETGLSGVKRRIDALNQPNPAQADAIVFALKSTAPPYRGDNQNTSPLRIKESHRVDVTPDALIGLAAEIGQGLISKTHYIERVPFWSGLIPLDDKNYTVGVLSPDLYSGASGIGLFMAYLYQETGDGAVREIALDIHNHIGFLLRTKSGLSTVGAFSGLSSLIYADLHLTSVLGLDSSHTYERSFRHIARMMDHDENFDIISGAAGALIVATRYHQRTGSPAAYATAIAAADKLGASAKPQHRGIAWETLKGFDFPEKVGGVSHGVSGIAWALSEWAACSGESKWAALAQQAFLYEESLYDKEAKAWKDVRNGSHSCFWCYGAAGIGLVASEATNALSKPVCDDVVSRAKKSTWKSGSSGSHGLCHGDLGNAEIFRVTGDRQKTDALVHSVVADYRNNGIWKCGFPDDAMVPGLMCGLAGIGYGLLRHARPNTIPNVLTLDFPVG